jgi:hypothetical protein
MSKHRAGAKEKLGFRKRGSPWGWLRRGSIRITVLLAVLLVVLIMALGWLNGRSGQTSSMPPRATATPGADIKPPPLAYRLVQHPQAVVHILTIPQNGRYLVRPRVMAALQTVEQVAQASGAIAVLNGGYFDPSNQKSTAFVTQDGFLVADPRANDRLINNPSLLPDLDKILNRSEFRRYQCGAIARYAIARHQDSPPAGCQLVDALGGGPQLLPVLTAEAESFWGLRPGQAARDPIGLNQPNARSAIGITRDGAILWVMVAQALPSQPGLSLPALATLMADLGAVEAMNLDGGSSSALYYAGQAFYGKVDDAGQRVKRAVKSVLVLAPRSEAL